MSAVREMVGVEEMDGGIRVQSWPRLVREVAPVYGADGSEERSTADDEVPGPEMRLRAAGPQVPDPAVKFPDSDDEPLDPDVDPPDPDDEVFVLGERCAEAYMQADALQYQAMRLLVEFHRRDGWKDTGFSSTAEWLAWRIGIRPGVARERLRTALALEDLPQISRAMAEGSLSFTKVRALTRAATPENESILLELAQAGSAANLERIVRGWKALDRKSELTAEQYRHRSRRFSAFVDVDGMVVVRGRLDPEVGAMLMRAVEAASDALFREAWSEKGDAGNGGPASNDRPNRDPMPIIDEPNTELQETTPEQRRADAVGLIAERALAAGFGGGSGNGHPNGSRGRSTDAPISGTKAERYQVMLHVDESTLKEGGEPGQSELEDGTRVSPRLRSAVSRVSFSGRIAQNSPWPLGSAETSRRLSCDCAVVKISHGPDGEVAGAGRRTRTIPPTLRRALEARDRGCRFPGCGLRFTEGHHIQHWADGGETSLRNISLLCSRHHRAVHEGQVRICMDVRGQVAFFTPKGKALFDAPPARGIWAKERTSATKPGTAPDTTLAGASGPGHGPTPKAESVPQPAPQLTLRPAHLSGASKWRRDRDIPYQVEARAWEALDSG